MAITEAMLAQALLKYFQQHKEEFEEFLDESYHLGDVYVTWRPDPTDRRILVNVRREGTGGMLSERDLAIRIERTEIW